MKIILLILYVLMATGFILLFFGVPIAFVAFPTCLVALFIDLINKYRKK